MDDVKKLAVSCRRAAKVGALYLSIKRPCEANL
jgi:hypothetical protein